MTHTACLPCCVHARCQVSSSSPPPTYTLGEGEGHTLHARNLTTHHTSTYPNSPHLTTHHTSPLNYEL